MKAIVRAMIPLALLLTGAAGFAQMEYPGDQLESPESPETFLRRMQPVLHREEIATKTDEELKKIIVPKIEFHDTLIREAVDQMNVLIRAHNSEPSSFQIPPLRIRQFPIPAAQESPAQSNPALTGTATDAANKDASSEPKLLPPEEARISLSLSNTSLKEIIRYVTNLFGMVIDFQADAVWLKPMVWGIPVVETRSYSVPKAICTTRADAEELVKEQFPGFNPANPRGCSWNFNETTHVLTLRFVDVSFVFFEKWYARELLKNGFHFPPPRTSVQKP